MTDRIRWLQQQVLAARSEGQALRIVGGNSKAFMGRQLALAQQTLSLAEHRGILSYSPVELVLTARAGTPLAEIEAVLAEHNQMLSFEPPQFAAGATLGGTLACNLSGPGRPWWHSIRDQVLGIRLLNGYGEHLHFGGQVMKNVAGYDLTRLQAGAMGTLGVITEISLKVLPRPATSCTLTFDVELDEALSLMNRFALAPKPLSAACWLEGRLYLRLSGAASAVESTAVQWGATCWRRRICSGSSCAINSWTGSASHSRYGVSPSTRARACRCWMVTGVWTGAGRSAGIAVRRR